MDDIGREPDDGRPEGELVECPRCESMNVMVYGGEGHCLDCDEWFDIGPDPFDYPDD